MSIIEKIKDWYRIDVKEGIENWWGELGDYGQQRVKAVITFILVSTIINAVVWAALCLFFPATFSVGPLIAIAIAVALGNFLFSMALTSVFLIKIAPKVLEEDFKTKFGLAFNTYISTENEPLNTAELMTAPERLIEDDSVPKSEPVYPPYGLSLI